MRKFKFEITLDESDLDGDEFWENAISRDGTGIGDLTESLVNMIQESNLIVSGDREPIEVIKLISYTNE